MKPGERPGPRAYNRLMKRWLLMLALGGCDYCSHDSDCDQGQVCAQGVCDDAANVRDVHVLWTIDGRSPAGADCNLHVGFSDGNYKSDFGYAPLPCSEGEFTLVHIERAFDSVRLGFDDGNGGYVDDQTKTVDPETGIANFDLSVNLTGP
jgi:hypothetical protein